MISYSFKIAYEKFIIKYLEKYLGRRDISYYYHFNASTDTYSYNLVVQNLFEVEFILQKDDEDEVPTIQQIIKTLKTEYPEMLI